MKRCCYCKQNKKINEFSSPKQGACIVCVREYNKQYRAKTKVRRAQENRIWRQTNREHYKEHQYKYYATIKGRIQNLIKGARKRAKQKSVPIDITIDFIEQMWATQNGKCALTQIEFFIPQERTDGRANPFAPSIDRIDCSKGYTLDNVRLVCVAVNYALNEFGEEIFKRIAEAYLNSMIQTN